MLQRWRGDRSFHAHESARMDELNGLPLARFRRRAYAYGIDLCIVGLAFSLLHGFHFNLKESSEACGASWAGMLSKVGEQLKELAESAVYFAIALKVGKGQTPGKRLMKIRVVSLTGHGVSWWTAIERALGYGASFLEGGFGFFQYFLNKNRMCVHDRIAETIVIDLRKPRVEPPVAHVRDADDVAGALPSAHM